MISPDNVLTYAPPELQKIVVTYDDQPEREWVFMAPSLRYVQTFLPTAIGAPPDGSFQEARAVLFDLRLYLAMVTGRPLPVHLGHCPHCDSTAEPFFSRCEPMGYYCPDCGER